MGIKNYPMRFSTVSWASTSSLPSGSSTESFDKDDWRCPYKFNLAGGLSTT
jgi:hypothetical protein